MDFIVSYRSWFLEHAQKHKRIMEKLADYSTEEIIEYFRFENMLVNEADFCPLYTKNKKCHELEDLNCYFCGCPFFRFNDSGFDVVSQKPLKSYCQIDSKKGSLLEASTAIHQNCSACTVPHGEYFIKKNFNKDWLEVMKEVDKND